MTWPQLSPAHPAPKTRPSRSRSRSSASRLGAGVLSLAVSTGLGVGLLAREAAAQDPSSAAREVVARLRAGDPFQGDVRPLLDRSGALDDATLALLVGALRETQDDPRAEVARALIAAARAADPLAPRGGEALRDARVIGALVDPGLSRADGAKELCLEALLRSVPPAALAPHGGALAASLQAGPDPTVALVLAKARPSGGLGALEAAARADPTFGASPEVALAGAALGDVERERALIAAFEAAADPRRKRELAQDLGLVATPAALRALGAALRTPLVEASLSDRRSVRLDVLSALRLTFPDEPALFGHLIRDDAGYEAAERFVERRLGVRFTAPRPPFLTQEGAPY